MGAKKNSTIIAEAEKLAVNPNVSEPLVKLLAALAVRLAKQDVTLAALRGWVQTPRYKLTGDRDSWSQWHEGIDSAQGEVYDILEAP